jgi:RNA recognition motif-containing protein
MIFKYYQGFYDMGLKNFGEKTVAEILKEAKEREAAVTLRGIPFAATKDDIVKFMEDFEVKSDSIHFEIRNSRFSGRAVVFLADEDQAKEASLQLNKKYIGSRYIEVNAVAELSEAF